MYVAVVCLEEKECFGYGEVLEVFRVLWYVCLSRARWTRELTYTRDCLHVGCLYYLEDKQPERESVEGGTSGFFVTVVVRIVNTLSSRAVRVGGSAGVSSRECE